jgi:DNA ligase 1
MKSTCFPFQLTTINDDNEFGVENILNVTDLKAAVKSEFMAGLFNSILDPSDFAGANVLIMQIENWDDNNKTLFGHHKNWKTIDAFKKDFEDYPFIIVTAEEHQLVINNTAPRDVFYVFFPLMDHLSAGDLIQSAMELQNSYLVSDVPYFSFLDDVCDGYDRTDNPTVEVNEAFGDLLSDLRSGRIKKNLPFIQYYNTHIWVALDFNHVYGALETLSEDDDHFFCNCPLHEDKDVSFIIIKDDLNWECTYGCGQGNPISYVQRKNLLIYQDAVNYLSKQLSIKQKVPQLTLTHQEVFQQLWEIEPNINIYPINGELYHAHRPNLNDPSKNKYKRVSNFSIQLLFRLKSSSNPFDTATDYMVRVISTTGKQTTIVLKDNELATNKSFKTKVLNEASLTWSGTATALDSLKEYLMLARPSEIRMVKEIGYDVKSNCYLLGDILFDSQGDQYKVDQNGFFPKQNLCLDQQVIRSSNLITKFVDISIVRFLDELFGAFGGKGILVFSYYVSSLFGRQIIDEVEFFPFMSIYGDTHTGKTNLTNILNKCFFQNWPGITLSKSNTNKGLIRTMGVRKNFVTPLLEGTKSSTKTFDQGMLLEMYHWNDISISAQLGSDSSTRSRKYEGSLLFVQNNEWFDSKAVIERMVSLPFYSKDNSDITLKNLNKLKSYSDKQLASIGKQILERRNEIEPALFEWIEKIAEYLEEVGCNEQRLIDNAAILSAGFYTINEVYDLEHQSKTNFSSFFEILTEITKDKEKVAEEIETEHDLASLFFENCLELLEAIDQVTNQPAPKLIKGEHYIIEDGLLYLRITETINVFKENKKQVPTAKSLMKELENHPAIHERRKEKRSSLWTYKKIKPGDKKLKTNCTVLKLDELDDIWTQTGKQTSKTLPVTTSKSIKPVQSKVSKKKNNQPVAANSSPKQSKKTDVLALQSGGSNLSETLYKRTTVGKIQQWRIQVKGNKFHTISGQKDGKQTTSKWTVCSGKNVDKANATTDEEQALKEAEAKFNKQLKEGYHCELSNIDNITFVKPMLARKYKDKFDSNFANLYSQPKLDGMRCIVNKDDMFSRKGNPILSAPHIFEALKPIFVKYPGIIFDGELYTDALKDDFNKIISLAKKTKPSKEDLNESAEKLEYWVYDIITDDVFAVRFNNLSQMLKDIPEIVIVPTLHVTNQTELDELFQSYLVDGMEGQMVRDGDSEYKPKRTKNLLKRKDFQDGEFTVVSLNEGKGNYSGMIKTLTVRTDKGIECDATMRGNQNYLKSLMKSREQYVGNQATVKYQNITNDGKLRFATVIRIWDEKRDV